MYVKSQQKTLRLRINLKCAEVIVNTPKNKSELIQKEVLRLMFTVLTTGKY